MLFPPARTVAESSPWGCKHKIFVCLEDIIQRLLRNDAWVKQQSSKNRFASKPSEAGGPASRSKEMRLMKLRGFFCFKSRVFLLKVMLVVG